MIKQGAETADEAWAKLMHTYDSIKYEKEDFEDRANRVSAVFDELKEYYPCY